MELYSRFKELRFNVVDHGGRIPETVIKKADQLRLEADAVIKEHGNKGQIRKHAEAIQALCLEMSNEVRTHLSTKGFQQIADVTYNKKPLRIINKIDKHFKAIANELKFEYQEFTS